MDNQYTSSGFQLYGQQIHPQGMAQTGQTMNQAASAQVGAGYTFLSAVTAAPQTNLTSLRGQGLSILPTDTTGQPKPQQQNPQLGTAFQTQQTGQSQQQTQQRVHGSGLSGLSSQQLQYLQSQQGAGQVSAQTLQQYSNNASSLGTIQIIPQKTPGQGTTQSYQQGQNLQHAGQGLSALQTVQPAAPLPSQQALQNLQNLQALQGFQTVPGVQVIQQYPGYTSQGGNPQKTGGGGFQSLGQGQMMGNFQRPAGGRQGESLFSNSNQRGGFGHGAGGWNDRDKGEFRGRMRDRHRRDDKGIGIHRGIGREGFTSRMPRDRELFRRDRGRERFGGMGTYRDSTRRETGFSKDRRSPGRYHDFKRDEGRKDLTARRDASSKGGDSVKDFKSVSHSGTPSRSVADYSVKVPQVTFGTYERDYSDIARRYTHLHVSSDFTRLVCCWVKETGGRRYPYGCTLCPLNKPAKLEIVQAVHEPDVDIHLPASKNNVQQPLRWNAKCTFICGLDEKAYEGILKGKFDGGTHLLNALKFVTVREEKDRKKTGIMCLGGPYDPALDGGDPLEDSSCLQRACIRHVKNQILLDLTPCQSWIRFCDIHYKRSTSSGEEYDETTVIFLVDVSDLLPSVEEWPGYWKEQQEWKEAEVKKEEAQQKINGDEASEVVNKTEEIQEDLSEKTTKVQEAVQESVQEEEEEQAPSSALVINKEEAEIPSEPALWLKCRSVKNGKIKTMAISLDGLLDYDETDKDETTFELSLLAESFNEMLMRDYGKLVLEALIKQRAMKIETKMEEKKRRSVENEDQEPAVKKAKQTETTAADMESIVEEPGGEEILAQDPKAAEEGMEVQYQDSPSDVVHVLPTGEEPPPCVESTEKKGEEQETEETAVSNEELQTVEVVKEEGDEDVVMSEVVNNEAMKSEVVVNEELLFAFRYFDRAGCGYIKCDDMRRLLHNLGSCLAPRVVRELVHGAAAIGKEKHKLDRVYYKSLTEMEATP